jgi:hypothetical protein
VFRITIRHLLRGEDLAKTPLWGCTNTREIRLRANAGPFLWQYVPDIGKLDNNSSRFDPFERLKSSGTKEVGVLEVGMAPLSRTGPLHIQDETETPPIFCRYKPLLAELVGFQNIIASLNPPILLPLLHSTAFREKCSAEHGIICRMYEVRRMSCQYSVITRPASHRRDTDHFAPKTSHLCLFDDILHHFS